MKRRCQKRMARAICSLLAKQMMSLACAVTFHGAVEQREMCALSCKFWVKCPRPGCPVFLQAAKAVNGIHGAKRVADAAGEY